MSGTDPARAGRGQVGLLLRSARHSVTCRRPIASGCWSVAAVSTPLLMIHPSLNSADCYGSAPRDNHFVAWPVHAGQVNNFRRLGVIVWVECGLHHVERCGVADRGRFPDHWGSASGI